MPVQRAVISLPEQPDRWLSVLARDLQEKYFEPRGYLVTIRYGRDSFDDDPTPVDGTLLPAVVVHIEELG